MIQFNNLELLNERLSLMVPHLISIWNPFLDWIRNVALLRAS